MAIKKVLLVDDEEIILESISQELIDEGFEVATAISGEEAISKISNSNFDLVLTDLIMPGVGGLQVLEGARKNDPNICVIIYTGYGDMTSAIEALRLGADDYLIKPCNIDEIHFRINQCLEKRELQKKVKIYEKILPICSYCSKIRDDSGKQPGKGEWMEMEKYLLSKSGADLSHGICPCCYDTHVKKEIDSL